MNVSLIQFGAFAGTRFSSAIALAVVVGFGFLLLGYSYLGAPIVPIWDGWTWIAQAMAYADGGLGSLVERVGLNQGDQIYVLPSLIALFTAPALGYSFRPFALLAAALLLALGMVFYRLARRVGLMPIEASVVFICVTSFRHFENLLLGFQFGIVLSILAGVLAITIAGESQSPRGAVAATMLAIIACLSSSAGSLALVVVALIVATRSNRPFKWLTAIALVIGSLAAFYATLAQFHVAEPGIPFHVLSRLDLGAVPRFFLDWLKIIGGGVVGGKAALAAGLPIAAVACGAIGESVICQRRIRTVAGLALFSLLTALAVTIARSPFDEPASRHAIAAAPAVGVFAIRALQLFREKLGNAGCGGGRDLGPALVASRCDD